MRQLQKSYVVQFGAMLPLNLDMKILFSST